ncbi:E3 ubiquitin-protein ligase DOA10 [Sphingomonas zeicaulis]|uniref:hypothetical protein n=1 Tax=Sphingomonas zeicaulis TaxID=1632740 RepID=UPI003D237146
MLILFSLSGAAASAAEVAPGRWKIQDSQVAPWATSTEEARASDEMMLDGRSIDFRSNQISAPEPLNCERPAYRIANVPPDYLFQGSLRQPAADARSLGFRTAKIPTLKTGCEGLIDFHFIDDGTAMFALNNRLYTIVRDQ